MRVRIPLFLFTFRKDIFMSNDNVNHPSHYTQGDIECIDAIKASMTSGEFAGYLKGNCMKYIWRYTNKVNPVEDLKKARWYLDKLIGFNEEEIQKANEERKKYHVDFY